MTLKLGRTIQQVVLWRENVLSVPVALFSGKLIHGGSAKLLFRFLNFRWRMDIVSVFSAH